jgi:hypothetical protein
MDSYDRKVYFHLPGIFHFWQGYKEFLTIILNRPGILKDNAVIGSVYGSPQCIWNGGRVILHGLQKTDLTNICTFMETMQIPVRFTFTNCLLEQYHIMDTYGNLLLQIFNNGKNEVICNSQYLEDYIRSAYKDRYKYISSTTKRLNDKELQNQELEKDYYLVVLDYDHNKNFEYLQSIPNKEKCELLCNPVCKPNCPNRKNHYEAISFAQLNFISDTTECQDMAKPFYEAKNNPAFISIEDINNAYAPMGFQHFKLEGRTGRATDWIEIILYYLVKEKYHDEIRHKLLSLYW